jgi:hypothetical protein
MLRSNFDNCENIEELFLNVISSQKMPVLKLYWHPSKLLTDKSLNEEACLVLVYTQKKIKKKIVMYPIQHSNKEGRQRKMLKCKGQDSICNSNQILDKHV